MRPRGSLRLGPRCLSFLHRLALQLAQGVAADTQASRCAGPDLCPYKARCPTHAGLLFREDM